MNQAIIVWYADMLRDGMVTFGFKDHRQGLCVSIFNGALVLLPFLFRFFLYLVLLS